MKKGRKKSLVGWAFSNWNLLWGYDEATFGGDIKCVFYPMIMKEKRKFNNPPIKVRITIEEVV
jgi:hypothetical protein